MGKSLFFVGLSGNFVPGYIKNVDTHLESFSFKKTNNKKVIAKKPLTNLYEMNNSQDIKKDYKNVLFCRLKGQMGLLLKC